MIPLLLGLLLYSTPVFGGGPQPQLFSTDRGGDTYLYAYPTFHELYRKEERALHDRARRDPIADPDEWNDDDEHHHDEWEDDE